MATESNKTLRSRWEAIKRALLTDQQCARSTGLSSEKLRKTLEEVDRLIPRADTKNASSGVLRVDGAARGNPGPAGAGIRLETENGKVLTEEAVYLGEATNNVAEYQALIRGLETAKNAGLKRLQIHTDSQLLARQVNGRYRVKNAALIELWSRVRELLNAFEEWSIQEVPRSENKDADRLANLAIDRARTTKKKP